MTNPVATTRRYHASQRNESSVSLPRQKGITSIHHFSHQDRQKEDICVVNRNTSGLLNTNIFLIPLIHKAIGLPALVWTYLTPIKQKL